MFNKVVKNSKIALVAALFAMPFGTMAEDAQFNIAAPQINAQTYVLMDYNSGAVLASLNPDQRQYPASLTKMMTSYVVGQALKQGKIHNTDMVTIGESAWGQNFPGSSKMFLNLNQQVSVADLNRGIIVVSGNDACVAMAEHVSGTVMNFVDAMNKYVEQFGLKNTRFTTVHGLDEEGQYSSARDMAIIGAHIIRDLPEEYKIYAEKDFTFNKIKQPNRNGLLWDKTINVDGMKTGHTDKAGYNLVASATNPNNMRLISVVMGVPTYKGREVESKKLLQWGFANFETFKTFEAGKTGKSISEQRVYYGDESNIQLGVLQDAFITIPKGKSSELKARYELEKKYLEAPLAKGQVVGKVIYQLEGKDVASVNLQVMQEVKEGGIFGKIWDWLVLTIKSLFD
ncbi:serine-type D-Ala-D-Ala carboxypeptidase [Aggregatibacter aphrophilus]|mgnify:FL=1|jgi:dacC protein|uniref:serine hydrolase n=1 Tax=Aggregatibacter kilianii TaxID=2025884 RepID=UPI000DACA136|nr:serine hydrolase [Aggregatibacter kilianii]RDF01370.1 serine-type D-Ala-D-Ala carboxypeptidase [Aggregatibacter aphrophilus]